MNFMVAFEFQNYQEYLHDEVNVEMNNQAVDFPIMATRSMVQIYIVQLESKQCTVYRILQREYCNESIAYFVKTNCRYYQKSIWYSVWWQPQINEN